MRILGIESSCDETAVSIVDNGYIVLSNIISSQIAKHAEFGGVVPELAAREHIKNISWCAQSAITKAAVERESIDAVAVTNTPGLIPALSVGVGFAKGFASAMNCPLIGVNHCLGHIYAGFIDNFSLLQDKNTYPLVALVVSGGHTSILLINFDGSISTVGRTIDDAAGEAFDKAAKLLGLAYPGGPIIDKLARDGDSSAIKFPRPLMHGKGGKPLSEENRFNFSFSGLKTSLFYHIKKKGIPKGEELKDTVASYQQAIVDVLIAKTLAVAEHYNAKTIILSGGVACNSQLRSEFQKSLKNQNVIITKAKYCTDNAVMIAALAFHYAKKGINNLHNLDITARPEDLTSVPFL